MRTYLDIEDEVLVEKAQEQILAVSRARMLFAFVAVPGLIPKRRAEQMKKCVIEYIDMGMELLVF